MHRRVWHRLFGHGHHQFYEVRWQQLYVYTCKCGYSPRPLEASDA